jgi:hypothetical protein
MIRKTLSASLLAALFLATPAFAEEATIGRPIEGGSLHEGHLDMVVYYVPIDGDLLEATATFAPKTDGDPLRVVCEIEQIADRRNSPLKSRARISDGSGIRFFVVSGKICLDRSMRYHASERSSGSEGRVARSRME